MKKEEAIKDYEELTYDLAKIVSELATIKGRVNFINEQMKWDGMFEISFSEAMEKLAEVQSAMICYALEEKYIERDIKNHEDEAKSLKRLIEED